MQKVDQAKTIVVIGAGAAGLVTAKEFSKYENNNVIVIESEDEVGGTWYYKNKRSSMYQNLRTNLPREIMAFDSFPFNKTYNDSRQYPSHEEVQSYLIDYANDVRDKITFNEEV